MLELSNVLTRRSHPNDYPILKSLVSFGYQFTNSPHKCATYAIVAELPTLSPLIIGMLGFRVITSKAKLMKGVYIQQLYTDRYLTATDRGKVSLQLIEVVCLELAAYNKGYIKIDLVIDDAWSRSLLESHGWSPLSIPRDQDEYITYVWYVQKATPTEE